jgi:hypothetical protein
MNHIQISVSLTTRSGFFFVAPLLMICLVGIVHGDESDHVDFNRDIRPILSDTCFKCHGPDAESRAADLRLDNKQDVFDVASVVVPGDLDASELYQRIISDDKYSVMPPHDSGRSLTSEQKEKIKIWIENGAQWSLHWSLEPIKKAQPPSISDVQAIPNNVQVENPIDNFVFAQLAKRNLAPQVEADRRTLIRRVTFDLTGLPPTLEEVEAFVNDQSTNAYERVVDRLLNTPQYGEHMARFWLDVARYGDTHGLHLDNYREMWPYRDWVIDAFNSNMPYDRFGTEQLAGDLLDKPTEQQLIATGFNRAHVTTAEGGSIDEEVYVRNVIDRVNTTGIVFMGLTVGCAQCHDHKFDPFTQKEYFELFAYFNSLDGPAQDGNQKDPPPVLKVPDPVQRGELARLKSELDANRLALENALDQYKNENGEFVNLETIESGEATVEKPVEFVWVDDELPAGAKPTGPWQYSEKSSGPVFSGHRASTRTAMGLSQHFFIEATIPLNVDDESTLFTYVFLDPENPPKEIMLQWNDGTWDHRAYWGENRIDWGADNSPSRFYAGSLPQSDKWVRLEIKAADVGLMPGSKINGWAFTQFDGTVYWDRSGIISQIAQASGYRSFEKWLVDQKSQKFNGLPEQIKKIAQSPTEKWNQDQTNSIKRHFVLTAYEPAVETLAPLREKIEHSEKALSELNGKIPTTLIWKELKEPRKAYVLKRGQYDQRGEEVFRSTPSMLPPRPENAPNDRLGFAQWLFSGNHPLTARVAVNRFWQQVFGRGIVKTSEDFGAQGQWPSHPQLLDWLAADFQQSGWDIKQLMKTIVMSATYRQSTRSTPDMLVIDPQNVYYWRGPRYRLDAEMLRDQALSLGGVLVETIGGPSVKPPQPDGLWFAVGYSGSNTVRFKKDEGHEKVHRRSMYTFWKRTAPPPQMNIFDAPSREAVCVRRERTNTPLQALLLLNDPQYVEAARYFAKRAIQTADSPDAQIRWMFEMATCRQPSTEQLQTLLELYQTNLAEFVADPERARNLTSIGETPETGDDGQLCTLAAMTTIANLILNLDEVVTKN